MADIKRLIGDDGKLMRASTAATVTSGTLPAGWYKVAVNAGSSFGDLVADDYFYAPSTKTLVAGDTAYAVTTTDMADLSGWSLELSGDEIEVTVLADTYKKYRKGKLDANGTASFVFIRGETDADAGLAHYFFKEATISASGVVSNVLDRSSDSMLLVGYIDNEDTSADYKLATVFEVEFYNFSLPMNSSEAVNMEVPFRLSGATDPILLKIYNP
jgi:hypothetical protein